ncbi:MAG: AAC(3) family N-acetyltransferase [Defluviitaleaceae bacterium]|nr:AAC(3) family N-acetyltransferase [Defluviitaleaceae bacterium]
MHTVESLVKDLGKSGIDAGGTLLVHSSYKSIGECENRGDTVIDAFIEYMGGGLLIFPTHTWETVRIEKDNVFDHACAPSCVGILPDLFMKREGVIRSLHPTHSLAALGEGAEEFVSGEEFTRTPCPRNGCYGKLYDRNAQILFLGCELSKNTYLHGVEEWNNVPNRLRSEPHELFIKIGDRLISCPQYRHHYPGGDISENYKKAEPIFIEKGAASYCKIGDAHSVLCDAVRMADIISEILQSNPNFFEG